MEMAIRHKENLDLEFDSIIWGYSLLSEVQSCEDKLDLKLLLPTIDVIQELLADDADGIESLKEFVVEQATVNSETTIQGMIGYLQSFEKIGVKKIP